jgi:prepilin-type N-terminal cleavage/methylation domain-containing protein
MPRNRKGFTLIELLIVVVIIGILAAIALPKFGQTRERAYISAMQSDLRNLQSSQEMYYADNNYEYLQTGTITSAGLPALNDFAATTGVTIVLDDVSMNENVGYGAMATHDAHPDATYTCVLIVGGTAPQGIRCGSGEDYTRLP